MSRNILTADAIDNCTDISILRAHVIACGLSGVWFDLNVEGSVRFGRVYAHAASDQWILGY